MVTYEIYKRDIVRQSKRLEIMGYKKFKDYYYYMGVMDTLFEDGRITEEESIEIREGLDAFREEYLKLPSCCEDEYLHIGSMEDCWRVGKMGYDSPEERETVLR